MEIVPYLSIISHSFSFEILQKLRIYDLSGSASFRVSTASFPGFFSPDFFGTASIRVKNTASIRVKNNIDVMNVHIPDIIVRSIVCYKAFEIPLRIYSFRYTQSDGKIGWGIREKDKNAPPVRFAY